VMKEKKELLMNLDLFLIPTIKRLQEGIQSLYNLSFLKIIKIEPANNVQSFFSKTNPFSTC
jgi:hypothetical protein